MPALPNVPNVLRADLLFSIGSDTSVSTKLHFRYSGGAPDSTDATALAADIYSAAAPLLNHANATTSLIGVRVTDLSSGSGGQGEHAQTTGGTEGGGAVPAGSCVLVNYLIARRYRGGKPRSYWPFGSSGDLVTPQTWSGSYVSGLDSALATMFAAIIGSSSGSTSITEHVNVSYYSGFTVVTNPITGRAKNVSKLRTVPAVDVINSFAANQRVGSQRRRN